MLFKENSKYGVSFEGRKGGRWDVMLREECGQVGRQYWGLKTENNQRQVKSLAQHQGYVSWEKKEGRLPWGGAL